MEDKYPRIYLIEDNIYEEINKNFINSEYKIEVVTHIKKLPDIIERNVKKSWDLFEKKNINIAKDNKTYFFLGYDKEKKIDYVFEDNFRYVQTLGRDNKFEKYACEVAASYLTALSSLCLVRTKDNKFIFGIKTNMDNKISGFSGYINKKYLSKNHINIYNYLSGSLKNEIGIPESSILNFYRIGQSYSPDISDEKEKLNNKVYNNIYIANLNLTEKEVKTYFKESYQFKNLLFINNNELNDFTIKNQNNMSIHCLVALYCYLVNINNRNDYLLLNALNYPIIIDRKSKIGIMTTVDLIKKLDIFKWGIIGNSEIQNYSIAPYLWKKLFNRLNYPVNYKIFGDNIEKNIIQKIKLIKQDRYFKGVNVAMPWKSVCFSHSDVYTEEINKIKTANTIINNQNNLDAYNTDGQGIINAIENKTQLKNKKILVLGTGGATQSIPIQILNKDIETLSFCDLDSNKSKKICNLFENDFKKNKIKLDYVLHENLEKDIHNYNIIINATPCGMLNHPKYPFQKQIIKNLKKDVVVVEMVYNPYKTPLLIEAKKNNLEIIEGIHMLVEQASLSFNYSFGINLTTQEKIKMKEDAKWILIQ